MIGARGALARRLGHGAAAIALLASGGCEARVLPARTPVYADVAPILAACVPCHGPERAEADYRADSYLASISCPADAGPAVEPPDDTAPILAALARDDHRALLGERDAALLALWVEAGAPPSEGAAHPVGWADPRSEDFHGVALRAEHWQRMLDPTSVGACVRCHDDGTPRSTGTAPGAVPCASCHDDEGGPRACTTCHGSEGHAYPPRDPCFHPVEAARTGGAHAAHARGNVGCEVCHGMRTLDALAGGLHGNGVVEVVLDLARAGPIAVWDPTTRRCTGTCHDRGGSTPTPRWIVGAGLDCGSCHLSPPRDHYAGTCDRCHAEAAPDGRSLIPGPLHADGIVEIGDGTGGCGACHGHGTDATPQTPSHLAHASPTLASTFACSECHHVPGTVVEEGHLDHSEGAEVIFGALAHARGSAPTIDASRTCDGVACHGAGLGEGSFTTPTWDATDHQARACGACHGTPPPPPHADSTDCGNVACHGAIVGPGPSITEVGRALHVNGRADLGGTP